MEREAAVILLNELLQRDLRVMADEYKITVWKSEGKKNKGWAGHTIERYLGLPINSSRAPNFGSWELKTIPLKMLKNGKIAIKETMAITMIDPINIINTPFEQSHLLLKMKKMIIGCRMFCDVNETESIFHSLLTFNLDNPEIYQQVKEDYDLVRKVIIEQGFSALSGKMGVYIQPRTKGPGHGSTSRAFYARATFLKKLLEL